MASLPIAFGPVLSRRLGWSLGVNHLRPKTCSYSCIYCQAGPTTRARTRPELHYDPDDVVAATLARVADCRESNQRLDVVTFIPDGEPTLDASLGDCIEVLRAQGLRVAVISNGSLLHRPEVEETLRLADIVSLKVDTVDTPTWRKLNRPVGTLDLGVILRSLRAFAHSYDGALISETMLVGGVNDDVGSAERVADFLTTINPDHAYITVPTRPGAESWARRPSATLALRAAEAFASRRLRTTLLTAGDDVGTFARADDTVESLIGILAVHPMSEHIARRYADAASADWGAIERLIEKGRLVRVVQDGTAYLRIDHTHANEGSRP